MSFEYNVHPWPGNMPSLMASAAPQNIMSMYGGYQPYNVAPLHPNVVAPLQGGHTTAPAPLIGSSSLTVPLRNQTSSAVNSLFTLRNGVLNGCVVALNFGEGKLASTGDHTVAVYSTHDWRVIRTMNGRRSSRFEALVWDPKTPQHRFATLSPNDRSLKLWDLRVKADHHNDLQLHMDGANAMTFNTEGTALILTSPNTVGVFDIRQNRMMTTKKFEYQVYSPCLIGTSIAIGNERGGVELLDSSSLHVKGSFSAHISEVTCVALNPGNPKVFATGGNDGIVQLWTLENGAGFVDAVCHLTIDRPVSKINSISFSGNGRLIAISGQGDKTIDIAHTSTGEQIMSVPNDTPVTMATFSRGESDQVFLAYGTENSRDVFVQPVAIDSR